MSSPPTVGRLVDIDLRDVWASEPYSFTPWLATEENLQFLAESLELPGLELVRTEHPVDQFSADIVCTISGSDHHVLIENQLERTDHIHLGQLLTYAPRFDAKAIIWVARSFTDAHRAALDWLNRITGESYAFFGVEVRAVRIGDSLPAPLFDVVAKPNDWTKLSSDVAKPNVELTALQNENADFWQAFDQRLALDGGVERRVKSAVKGQTLWIPLAPGGAAYVVAWRSMSAKPHVGAYIGIYGDDRGRFWDRIQAERNDLETAYGGKLDWQQNRSGSVFKVVSDVLPSAPDRADWPAQHQWLANRVNDLARAFGHVVRDVASQLADRKIT
jgi:hypothetical protein